MWFIRQVQARKLCFDLLIFRQSEYSWQTQTQDGISHRHCSCCASKYFQTSIQESAGCLVHFQKQMQGSSGSLFQFLGPHAQRSVIMGTNQPRCKVEFGPLLFQSTFSLKAIQRLDTFVLILLKYEVNALLFLKKNCSYFTCNSFIWHSCGRMTLPGHFLLK